MTKLAFYISIFFSLNVFASAINEALVKYSKASSLVFDIKKTDEKKSLGTKSNSSGVLVIQKNKIYISLQGEKKSEIFYSTGVLTLVEHPDLELDAKSKKKVVIFKKGSMPLIKNLLSLFYSADKFKKEFTQVNQSIDGSVETTNYKPADVKINSLTVKTSITEGNIQEISFEDDLKNKTTILLSNQKLNEKISSAKFLYKTQATDEVVKQ